MRTGTLQWLIDLFISLFQDLSLDVQMKEVEDLAVLVHRQMSVESRNYHNLDHVISLLDESDPIQSLAALFHDIVYYQVDRGIAPEVCSLISPYIHEADSEIWLQSDNSTQARLVRLTMGVFGYQPGQKLLVNHGLNEFLSALFMNERLQSAVPEDLLVQLTACVEATIPFRGPGEHGQNPFNALEKRLQQVNREFNLGLEQAQIEDAVRRAVKFANQDVFSFADQTRDKFLEDNWKLLPEMNVALRSDRVYLIREYRQALYKMDRFLQQLDPQLIFHSYKGEPRPEIIRERVEQVEQNINQTRDYLAVKLVTAGILEALSEISGGDAPLALFMGENTVESTGAQRLEHYLPEVRDNRLIDPSTDLYRLFQKGRVGSSTFDTLNAPLSLFLLRSLGPEAIKQLDAGARRMFEGEMDAMQFLALVDGPVISAVARAAAEMVVTRRAALSAYAAARSNQSPAVS